MRDSALPGPSQGSAAQQAPTAASHAGCWAAPGVP